MLRSGWALAGVVAGAAVAGPAYLATRYLSARRAQRMATPEGARRALARLGWRAGGEITAAPLGCGRSNAVVAITAGGKRMVLKQALPVGSVLAFGAGVFGPMPYHRDVSSVARCQRELSALTRLRAAGVGVPRVLAADPDAGLLLLEHVDGTPLMDVLAGPDGCSAAAHFGAALRAAHDIGLALTDCHPGNALRTGDGRVVLLDLEFAESLPADASEGAGEHGREHGRARRRGERGERARRGEHAERGERDERARRYAFDIAYAAAFMSGETRAAFIAAACPPSRTADVAAASRRLDAFGPLFARERERQQTRAA